MRLDFGLAVSSLNSSLIYSIYSSNVPLNLSTYTFPSGCHILSLFVLGVVDLGKAVSSDR